MKKFRSYLFHLKLVFLSIWHFKVLGRKRDRSKDRDCKWFEESGVNAAKFQIREGFDEDSFQRALMAKNQPLGHDRYCCGDGHYKCYECMNLDYVNSDLIQSPILRKMGKSSAIIEVYKYDHTKNSRPNKS